MRCSLAFESERIVQLEMSLSSVLQEFQKARAAGEATKKQLPESEGTAGDCKKRCDALQASQRDAGQDLSGVRSGWPGLCQLVLCLLVRRMPTRFGSLRMSLKLVRRNAML